MGFHCDHIFPGDKIKQPSLEIRAFSLSARSSSEALFSVFRKYTLLNFLTPQAFPELLPGCLLFFSPSPLSLQLRERRMRCMEPLPVSGDKDYAPPSYFMLCFGSALHVPEIAMGSMVISVYAPA
ncbi:MAG: hypothetical protein MZV70_77530 [Desulfobacterales bacterium]|nr:hypothetical protein [Desulfobacterales bacterium]